MPYHPFHHANTTNGNGRRKKALATAIVLLAAVTVMLVTCGQRNDKSRNATQDDSCMVAIRQLSMTQPKLALAMLDTAERQRTLPMADINALRATVYSNAGNQNTAALRYALKAYADTSATARQPHRRIGIASVVAYQYFKCSAYDRSIQVADEAIALARQSGEQAAQARLLNTKAMCQSELGLTDKATLSFDEGIALLQAVAAKNPSWDNCSDLVDLYAQKANVLLDNNRYADVAAMQPDFEEALQQQMASGNEEVRGGNDHAQAIFNAVYAIVYVRLGNARKGYDHFTRLCRTQTARRPEGYTYLTPYLMATHRYGEAIEKLLAEEQLFRQTGRDTVDYYFVKTVLPCLAKALYGERRYREAAVTGLRATVLSDSLARRMKTQQALWTNEMLDARNKDLRIVAQAKDLRMSNGMAIGASLLLAVFVLLSVRVISYNRIIRRKNLAAAKTISELLAYKEQMAFVLRQQQKDAACTTTAQVGDSHTDSGNDTCGQHDNETSHDEAEHKLFIEMEQRIINDRLFLKPKLSRDDITSLLGIPKNRFATLFTRYSGKTFTRFINDMRLDYAAQQLCKNPNYSVEAIASECGIPVRQTFYRLFTEKFGLTPAEYRKNNEDLTEDTADSDEA